MTGRRVAILLVVLTALLAGCTQASGNVASKGATPKPSPVVDPVPAPTSPALAKTVSWRHWCPTGYGFCADFPYVTGSKRVFVHNVFTSATSATGMLDNFTSNIYSRSLGLGYCLTLSYPRCFTTTSYFVEVFRSKYTDPWTAITAINGGVQNPIQTSVQGNLAATFTKGIYGGQGVVVYHSGMVYYMEGATTGQFVPVPFINRFIQSLSFTS